MPRVGNKRRPSSLKHNFSRTPSANISRSAFNRSHGHKTTFNAGFLIPIFCDEVLPGDTFNVKMTALVRLATPLKPFMDNIYIDTHWFFVPYRQVWNNFRKMMGEQTNPGDTIDYTVPQLTPPVGGFTANGWADYMGLPLGVDNISCSILPYRAYLHIFNEWFRHQDIVNSQSFSPENDGGTEADPRLARRMKR